MENYTHHFEETPYQPLRVNTLCLYNFINNSVHARPHIHPGWEVGYVLKGCGQYHLDGACYGISRGDLVLVLPGTVHVEKGFEAEDLEMLFLLFHPSFSPAQQYRLSFDRSLVIGTHEHPHIEEMLRSILLETMEQKTGYEYCIDAEIAKLFISLCRILDGKPADRQDTASLSELVNTRKLRIVNEIKAFMEDNIQSSQNIQDVAARFYISPQHLVRLFKEMTSFTPKEYWIKLKIQKAEALLRDPALEIATIAEQLGYSDIHHFYRMFKKETTQTPLQFRKTAVKVKLL